MPFLCLYFPAALSPLFSSSLWTWTMYVWPLDINWHTDTALQERERRYYYSKRVCVQYRVDGNSATQNHNIKIVTKFDVGNFYVRLTFLNVKCELK